MEQRIGVEIIERALRAPISTIVKNAGGEGAVVCGYFSRGHRSSLSLSLSRERETLRELAALSNYRTLFGY
jgi:chaperonin GroEL (HSP60 family)